MNKQIVSAFFKKVGKTVVDHSPEILTAIGTAGWITATVLAVKATPKALEKIEEKKEELNLEPEDNLTPIETVKAAWKPYVPVVVTGVCATACLFGSHSIHVKRHAALMTAYQISTTALNEYKEKVVETIGEKKERVIHDKIAEDHVKKNPVSKSEVIFTDNGTTLALDILSGRYFKSSRNKIEKAMNYLNNRMNCGAEHCISLNEFYNEIGLPQTPIGEQIGWRRDKGLIEIHFGAVLTDDNDVPCMTIEYLVPPEHGFNDYY